MKKQKTRRPWLLPLLALLVLVPLAVLGALRVRDRLELSRIPALPGELRELAGLPAPSAPPETELGRALLRALEESWSVTPLGEPELSGTWKERRALQQTALTRLDAEQLRQGLAEEVHEILAAQALSAARSDQIYDGDGAFREELVRSAFEAALLSRLEKPEAYTAREELRLGYAYDRKLLAWVPEPGQDAPRLEQLRAAVSREPGPDAWVEALYQETKAAQEPVLRSYAPLAENAVCGPVPNPAFFGETDDPSQVEALLRTVTARRLIGEQELVWNPELERFPGSSIRYYLDDSILVLVWQEVEAQAVGTFSEIFIADGSQLRRKISGDEPFSFDFRTTSDFCLDANAVLAVGGDFYHHARACGICVYQREICRFEPSSCDTCYITTDGDMLFSYRGQFASEDEARQFIADNDVLFSLVFGPVLIDNGTDVTPEDYPWGEIRDDYARSALGLLGRHHYLTMNINFGEGQYYYLATLRQAADAMIRRGCIKAYTLDGGQTATTVFGGQLINPVQFGWEKEISDVIYFASALPNE